MLPIPSPPTDNLYKFISIAGLLILGVSVFLIYSLDYNRNKQVDNFNSKINELNILEAQVKNERWYIQDALGALYNKTGIKKKPTFNDFTKNWATITEGSPEIIREYKSIEQAIKKLDQTELARDFKKQNIEIMNSTFHFDEDENFNLKVFCSIMAFFGLLGAVFGFELWYKNHQIFQDKILEDQYKKVFINDTCQSCGVILFDEFNYTLKDASEYNKFIYCAHCYQDGQFNEPDLTLEQMKEIIKGRCSELDLGKSATKKQVKKLEELKRWKKTFRWS